MDTHSQWTFFGALRCFTRLPSPFAAGRDSDTLSGMRYFSSIGLIVGAIAAIAYGLSLSFWPRALAVLAAMITAALITGAMHEDGWRRAVDALGGACKRERTLEIMRDPRVGSFGAVALFLMLMTRFITLIEITPQVVPFALVAGHAFSRLCATVVFHRLGTPENKLGKADLSFAALVTLPPVIFLFLALPMQLIFALLFAAAATHCLHRQIEKRIGNCDRACLGGVQQLAEIAFYCGLLCKFS